MTNILNQRNLAKLAKHETNTDQLYCKEQRLGNLKQCDAYTRRMIEDENDNIRMKSREEYLKPCVTPQKLVISYEIEV